MEKVPDKEDYTKLSKEAIKSRIEELEQGILYSVPYDNWVVGPNCSIDSCTNDSAEEIQDKAKKLEDEIKNLEQKILKKSIKIECW